MTVPPFVLPTVTETRVSPHGNQAPAQCPHCGTAPADVDGFACDYCRGYAHRPMFNAHAFAEYGRLARSV